MLQMDSIEPGQRFHWPHGHSPEYIFTGISDQDGDECYKICRPTAGGPRVAIEVCELVAVATTPAMIEYYTAWGPMDYSGDTPSFNGEVLVEHGEKMPLADAVWAALKHNHLHGYCMEANGLIVHHTAGVRTDEHGGFLCYADLEEFAKYLIQQEVATATVGV